MTTTASVIADSTISSGTVDALYSHFPPPPSELPTPTTPRSHGFLIPVAPLRLPQRSPYPDVPSESSRQPSLQRFPTYNPPEEPAPQNSTPRQLRRQPSLNTYATNGTLGSLSPFDWHEGSSSIDIDPSDDRMLPTSFITSLISASEHGSPRSTSASMSPPQRPAQLFSGGNNLDAMSSISDATYPPHDYPPSHRTIPPGAAYLESSGRSTKTNSIGTRTSETDLGGPSVGSHTPFINPVNKYDPIEEDTMGELQARGETSRYSSGANPSKRSSGTRRQSLVSTRTTKSYVSSLISKLSRATSRRQPILKPLPPVPSIPNQLRGSDYRKFEESMPLPQLASRAEVLSKMLARGYRPDSNYSPSNPTSTPRMDVHLGSVSQTPPASRSNWPTIPEAPSFVFHAEEKATTPSRPVGFWDRLITKFGKRRIIVTLIVIALLLIVLAVLLGVLLKKSALPKCPAGKTGTDCDIGMIVFPLSFPPYLSYLPLLTELHYRLTTAATCVCVSGSSSMCVAQGLLDMLPATNLAFTTNFTTEDVVDSLFYAIGAPLNNDCAYQAIRVDAGSKLRIGVYPLRTSWARSALLWNLIQTTDVSTTSYIQDFLEKTDFTALGSDNAIDKSGYQVSSSGFVFDFAKMAVSFENISWKNDSQVSSVEALMVPDSLSVVLDRMYSNALGEFRYLTMRRSDSEAGTCFPQPHLLSDRRRCLNTGNPP